MSIGFRAAANAPFDTAGTDRTVGKPAGTVAGDLLIGLFGTIGGGTITVPSGWTPIFTDNGSSSNRVSAAYLVAGASEPSSYTASVSIAAKGWSWVGAYTGVDTAAPVDTSGDAFAANVASVSPALTVTAANAWLLYYGFGRHAAGAAKTLSTSDGSDVSRFAHGTSSGSGSDLSAGVWDSNRALPTGSASRTISTSASTEPTFDWGAVALKPASMVAPTARLYQAALHAGAAHPASAATARLYAASLQASHLVVAPTARLYSASLSAPLPANQPAGSGIFVQVNGNLQEAALYVCQGGEIL